jgi:hypothetical protein
MALALIVVVTRITGGRGRHLQVHRSLHSGTEHDVVVHVDSKESDDQEHRGGRRDREHRSRMGDAGGDAAGGEQRGDQREPVLSEVLEELVHLVDGVSARGHLVERLVHP